MRQCFARVLAASDVVSSAAVRCETVVTRVAHHEGYFGPQVVDRCGFCCFPLETLGPTDNTIRPLHHLSSPQSKCFQGCSSSQSSINSDVSHSSRIVWRPRIGQAVDM